MKKQLKTFSVLAATIALTACTNETDKPDTGTNPGTDRQVTLTATTGQTQTRVNLKDELGSATDGQVVVTWKEGDTFEVVDRDNSNNKGTFTLNPEDNGHTTGTFTGTLPEGSSLKEPITPRRTLTLLPKNKPAMKIRITWAIILMCLEW